MIVPQINEATRSAQCIACDHNYARRAVSSEMLWNGQACCEAIYSFPPSPKPGKLVPEGLRLSAVFLNADVYLDSLTEIALAARVQGAAIHDARIAAICRFHGVRELWSADRDFSRFAAVKVRNPLLE
jgi:hypothetical protein